MIPTPEEMRELRKLVSLADILDPAVDYRPLWPTSEMQSVLALLDEVFEKIGEAVNPLIPELCDNGKHDLDGEPLMDETGCYIVDGEALDALRDLREKYGKGAK